MFDVVIRGRCLTVVHDTDLDGCHAVVVDAGAVAIIERDGYRREIGHLTAAMAEGAETCEIAVVARMRGPMVVSSAQIRLIKS